MFHSVLQAKQKLGFVRISNCLRKDNIRVLNSKLFLRSVFHSLGIDGSSLCDNSSSIDFSEGISDCNAKLRIVIVPRSVWLPFFKSILVDGVEVNAARENEALHSSFKDFATNGPLLVDAGEPRDLKEIKRHVIVFVIP